MTGAMNSRHPFIHLFFWLFVLFSLVPFLLVFMVSISGEESILKHGYSLFPSEFSTGAYSFLFNDFSTIAKAYGVTIAVTLIGTVVSLLITCLYAYPLSRPDMPFRRTLSFFLFFTMLFGGGMAPWYLTYVNMFGIKNTLLSMIIPNLLLSAFNVLLMRSFFSTSIPDSILESATIDGASEWTIFKSIVIPLSLPIVATIGLFNVLAYWNDWYNCMLFIDKQELYNIQYLMTKTLNNVQYLIMKAGSNAQAGEQLAKMPRETVRMAFAVVGVAPLLAAYPFFQRFYISGITSGAVKG
ncbi:MULTISPECIES: carbohydrate ABC transporter permease [Paenibacillus]|uniref:carbohydrate ABC transporter permease n=1 Tax=Paenibacillus TaxID=44249 RepID=UPI000955673A|nr:MULTISPECIES: carbohydrate ABC transporter permease [Paenibacillus]ASS68686.1 carbohydrate ABC transporter permease [Paenibacillus sp. RUD330]SIR55795.1 putative aldouronate transport system permease protein [Paenibacillus sp. RU4X]SIR64292.1 putative aldouronate transport system permease protein [Paenibacillus sp. RU4T]